MDNGSKKDQMFQKMIEQKKEVKIVRRIVFVVALVLIIGGLIGGRAVYKYISEALQPVDPNSEEVIEVEIPIGSGLSSISEMLEKKGLIKDAKIFKYYAKFNNESQFQAGSYGLTKSMTLDELIESLKTGKVYRTPVFTMTIPEGLTLDQIAATVQKRIGIPEKEFLDYVNDEQTIANLMGRYPNILTEEILKEDVRYPLEGYLFPATYPFYEEKPSVETVVTTMLNATSDNITPYFAFLESKEKSVHWLLTFASLLEREATSNTDRETIASVFYNRMDEGMPLQTDPTVLYALGKHKDRVLFEDLKIENPYNTYVHTGLPPGPIANAGRSSIEAVVDPSFTDYFYFLADKEGNNHFAKTYDEHLANRAKYID
ncbi:endolytic transglycosylase MltG [Sporosarcina luteola]|uniref:endolytic transglycosylase MltG n=1 Tax=Sporosarcina luteola TaxID=582850 RepID=UPI002040FAAB|nr:endolytic transglycosylase MltG [Sporosarcina luteola]MCM3710815.1 endolytic transglycosylase MltG [Sporosarcina luteola]